MPEVIASGPNFDATDRHTILGLHGTIGEQKDETYYDERSDASDDDFEKGRIRFPRGKLYGRDGELKRLTEVYECVTVEEKALNGVEETDREGPPALAVSGPSKTARVVFLSGLSGTGKSALVDELVRQVSSSKGGHRPLVGSGKFEQFGESAPFGAISESLEMYAHDLLNNRDEEELCKVRYSLKNVVSAQPMRIVRFWLECFPCCPRCFGMPPHRMSWRMGPIKLIRRTRLWIMWVDWT